MTRPEHGPDHTATAVSNSTDSDKHDSSEGLRRPDAPCVAWTSTPVLAHVLPFALWLGLMVGLGWIGEDAAWKYAVRTLGTVALLCWARPWRWYASMRPRSVLPALAVGVLTFLIWVLPEIRYGTDVPLIQELYLRFGILPFGRMTPTAETSIYAPEVCGWWLTAVRIAGSAFVIALVEEFFWRGFLYRRLIQPAFLRVSLKTYDGEAFLFMCVLFGLEHQRVLAGIVAGALYGLLLIRTRDVWAAVLAHVVTNLLLGLFVVVTRTYAFW